MLNTFFQELYIIILSGNMMSAAHIQPGNLRQKFSKLLLYRLQCFLQVIRILFAERMKMQSVDPFQTFHVKVLSGNPQPGTRRTGIIDRMIPLSGAFRINTESQTGSGTHIFKFLQLCCGIKDNMVTDPIQFLYIFCTVSRGKNMILFPHLFISKPCLKQTAGSGTCQIFSNHGIQSKAGKRFLRQKDLTPGILLDFFQNLQILPHLLLIDHIAGSLQLINLHWLSRPLPVQDLRRLSMEVPICSVLPYMDPDQILPH